MHKIIRRIETTGSPKRREKEEKDRRLSANHRRCSLHPTYLQLFKILKERNLGSSLYKHDYINAMHIRRVLALPRSVSDLRVRLSMITSHEYEVVFAFCSRMTAISFGLQLFAKISGLE